MCKSKKHCVKYARKWLKRHFPADYSVRISFVTIKTIERANKQFIKEYPHTSDGEQDEYWYDGFAFKTGDGDQWKFKIYVNKDDSIRNQLDSMFHEYAHVLEWHVPDSKFQRLHGSVWRAHYNSITKAWAEHVPRA